MNKKTWLELLQSTKLQSQVVQKTAVQLQGKRECRQVISAVYSILVKFLRFSCDFTMSVQPYKISLNHFCSRLSGTYRSRNSLLHLTLRTFVLIRGQFGTFKQQIQLNLVLIEGQLGKSQTKGLFGYRVGTRIELTDTVCVGKILTCTVFVSSILVLVLIPTLRPNMS